MDKYLEKFKQDRYERSSSMSERVMRRLNSEQAEETMGHSFYRVAAAASIILGVLLGTFLNNSISDIRAGKRNLISEYELFIFPEIKSPIIDL